MSTPAPAIVHTATPANSATATARDSHPDQPLLLDIAAGVARIQFNRPAALNAINIAMAEAFHDACQRIRRDENVRVVVLSGAGKAFMAGGDLASFHANLSAAPSTANAIIGPLHAGLAILTELQQPVLASLHGAVAGAGVSIALACDLAYAADTTCLSLAYARIGASLDGGCSWSLPRIVGLRKAMELSLLAEPLNATQALHLGLVNRVVPAAMLEAEVASLAQRLATGPTAAFGRIKRLLRASLGNQLTEQLHAEHAAFCAGAAGEDFGEGLRAFFEKRQANFVGR